MCRLTSLRPILLQSPLRRVTRAVAREMYWLGIRLAAQILLMPINGTALSAAFAMWC
jgi:hypothetical protein